MEKFLVPPIKTDPKLLEALRKAAGKPMSEEEIKNQRESWVRGQLGWPRTSVVKE